MDQLTFLLEAPFIFGVVIVATAIIVIIGAFITTAIVLRGFSNENEP